MAKKGKDARKRAERRERAKRRASGEQVDHQEQEQAADERVAETDRLEAEQEAARDRKPARAQKEEPRESAWHRLSAFLNEVKIEAKKINWPSHDETVKSTMVVIITILFLAVFMGLVGYGFNKVSERLFGIEEITETAIPTNPLQAVDEGPVSTPTPDGETGSESTDSQASGETAEE